MTIRERRILVSGGSGFIGRHCLPLLTAAGFDVHALTHRAMDLPQGDWHWHRWDLLGQEPVDRLIAAIRPSHLLHLAWLTTPGVFWHSPDNALWVDVSVRLLEAAARLGTRRIVAAGSVAEYDWSAPGVCGGDQPLVPATRYGIAKDALRRALAAIVARYGVSAAWGRVFHLYGPYEHPNRLVPAVIGALLAGLPAETTDGTQRRDMLHVADVAAAMTALVSSEWQGAVDLASGEPTRLRDVIIRLGDLTGRPELLRLGVRQRQSDDPETLVAASSPLQEAGLWRPQVGLAEGLAGTVDWWRLRQPLPRP